MNTVRNKRVKMMKWLAALGVVFTGIALEGCNPGHKQLNDKEYKIFSTYSDIYKTYHKEPLDSTRQKLELFLEHFPIEPRAWTFYGRVLYDLKREDEAIDAYRKSIYYSPSYFAGYAGIGSIYTFRGMDDSAAVYLNKAMALKDSSAYTLINVATINLHKGDTAQSRYFANLAVSKNKNLASGFAGLSQLYKSMGDDAVSVDLYNKAVKCGLRDTAMFEKVLNKEITIQEYFRKNNY